MTWLKTMSASSCSAGLKRITPTANGPIPSGRIGNAPRATIVPA
jgi:hypothetical protein